MQGVGFGLALLGYTAWYTLYQKTWGDGTGFLYNLTGSSRFKGSATPNDQGNQATGSAGSSSGGAPTATDNQYNQGGTAAAPR